MNPSAEWEELRDAAECRKGTRARHRWKIHLYRVGRRCRSSAVGRRRGRDSTRRPLRSAYDHRSETRWTEMRKKGGSPVPFLVRRCDVRACRDDYAVRCGNLQGKNRMARISTWCTTRWHAFAWTTADAGWKDERTGRFINCERYLSRWLTTVNCFVIGESAKGFPPQDIRHDPRLVNGRRSRNGRRQSNERGFANLARLGRGNLYSTGGLRASSTPTRRRTRVSGRWRDRLLFPHRMFLRTLPVGKTRD